MRRKLETSKQFLALFATAHGRPVDERDHVGIGEQVASIHLIADFAASENSSGTRLARDSRTSLRGRVREPREGRAGRQNRTPSAQLSDRLDRGRAYAHGDRVEFRFEATSGAAEEVAAGLAGNAARTQVRA
jgi:hypothetical protein